MKETRALLKETFALRKRDSDARVAVACASEYLCSDGLCLWCGARNVRMKLILTAERYNVIAWRIRQGGVPGGGRSKFARTLSKDSPSKASSPHVSQKQRPKC